jgi:putative transposase
MTERACIMKGELSEHVMAVTAIRLHDPSILSRGAAKACSPRREPWACELRSSQQPRRGERRLSHTSGNILLHLIFSTAGRRPLIRPDFRNDLCAYIGGIARELRATALIINGTADHIHILVRGRPAQSAADLARVIKANSSGWVRDKWTRDFAWQTGYGVFSVSESNVAAVTKYIAGQEEHRKRRSFQEAFPAFLK